MARQTSGHPVIKQWQRARKRPPPIPALVPRGSITVIAGGPSEDALSFFRHSGMVSMAAPTEAAVMEYAAVAPPAHTQALLGFADLAGDMSDTQLVRALRALYRTEFWVIAELLAHYEPGDQAALLADEANIFHVGRHTVTLRWKDEERLFALEATSAGVRQFRRGSRTFAPL